MNDNCIKMPAMQKKKKNMTSMIQWLTYQDRCPPEQLPHAS